MNTDVPELDCIFLDYPDPVVNEYGARGVGDRLDGMRLSDRDGDLSRDRRACPRVTNQDGKDGGATKQLCLNFPG